MKKAYFLLFVLTICGVIYLVSRRSVPDSQTGTMKREGGSIERIISLCKHPVPLIIIGLDASDRRLVGINPGGKTSLMSNVLAGYFPGIQNISDKVCTTGFAPDMEEILRLNPDLVLTWSRFPEAIAQMQAFGLNVVGINYDGTDENDREMVNMIADAIGRKALADSIMQWRDSTLRQIKSVSDTIAIQNRPKVMFFYNYETLSIAGEKCYEHFCINTGGGRNLGTGLGLGRSVNIEQILVWDPEVIFLGGWLKSTRPEDIYQNPLFAGLKAVRNRRVYKMPVWASNESVLSWKWMAEALRPDLFDFDLRAEIRKSYAWQYKVNLTEDDIDEILYYVENKASYGYETFDRMYPGTPFRAH